MSDKKTNTINLDNGLLTECEEVVESENHAGSRVREILKEEEYYLKKLRKKLLELNDLCWILDYETPELYNKYLELDDVIIQRLQQINKNEI